MDKQITSMKLEFKIYFEGEKENASAWSIPLKFYQKYDGGFYIEIPRDLNRWIQQKASEELVRKLQPKPDPELMASITFLDEKNTEADIKVEKVTETEDDRDEILIVNQTEDDLVILADGAPSPRQEEMPTQAELAQYKPKLAEEKQTARPAAKEPDNSAASETKKPPCEEKETKMPVDEDESPDDDIDIQLGALPQKKTFEGLKVLLSRDVLRNAKQHAAEDTSREAGGVLLGTFVEQPEGRLAVVVTGIVRGLQAIRASASVNFTPETWADIWRSIDNDPIYADEKTWTVVGWYHTHPGFGIFLSSPDKFIHKEYFTHGGHIALVIDPQRRKTFGLGDTKHGFFGWDVKNDDIVLINEQVFEYQGKDLLAWLQKQDEDNLKKLKKLPPAEIEIAENNTANGGSRNE